MRLSQLIIAGIFMVFAACTNGQDPNSFAKIIEPKAGEKVATFAGGCFWALEEGMSELKGVTNVISGYAGGTTKNPTYAQVGSLSTGHAESVQVYYNPKEITYSKLVEAFLYAHDPTQLNRQGPDVGTDYRSVAFYRNEEEKKQIEEAIAKVNSSGHYKDKIVTQVMPIKVIYPAEAYHQDYYRLNPNASYIENVSQVKVMKLRKALPDLIKPEFKSH